MADHPILFSSPMILALLAGRKTQTRRILKVQPPDEFVRAGWDHEAGGMAIQPASIAFSPFHMQLRKIVVGDRLWVREAHNIYAASGPRTPDGKRWGPWSGLPTAISPDPHRSQIAYYRAGFDRSGPGRWRPSIHMPRWASRLTLTVTDVRVQRLQEISEADAWAEGAPRKDGCKAPIEVDERGYGGGWNNVRRWYDSLWDQINGAGAWDLNPFVAAYTFTVAQMNIDQMGGGNG